jgi:hypothetical protein
MASSKTRRRSRKARAARNIAAAPGPSQSGAATALATEGSAAAAAPEPSPARPPGRSQPKVAPRVSPKAQPSGTGRRLQREERERQAARDAALANRRLGTYGERPKSIFDPIPVSELAILLGLIAVVIGLIDQGGPALTVGAIVCGLGVLEFTAREHFSGYRSHATLLAAFPAILLEVLLAKFVGVPTRRILLLAPVVPVFGFSFWLLQRAFQSARHARVAKPPAP